jgi:hypothetical protein
VIVGYIVGTLAVPTGRTENLTYLSEDIQIYNNVFGSHSVTTLEQCLLVNSKNSNIYGNTFKDNTTANAYDLGVYGFSENVNVYGNHFDNLYQGGMFVQESDNVNIFGNNFKATDTHPFAGIMVTNSAKVNIKDNTADFKYEAGNGGNFIRVYDDVASTWESGYYTHLYTETKDLLISGNSANNVYTFADIGSDVYDTAHAMNHISIQDNTIDVCEGVPIRIGNGDNISMSNFIISGNIIKSFKASDLGAIWLRGSATALNNVLIENNIIPADTQSSNGYGLVGDKVTNVTIKNNSIYGKGNRGAIYLTNDDYIIITGNNLHEFGITSSRIVGTIRDNLGTLGNTQDYVTVKVKSADVSAIAIGDIVVIEAVASGYEVVKYGAGMSPAVYGMCVVAMADNTEYGYVQVLGKTTLLKVDGTTDIAIGDYIRTSAAPGIGVKASSGDVVIAKALEAYTANDSNGVIDALIINPMQI